jgi:hypothetical protein
LLHHQKMIDTIILENNRLMKDRDLLITKFEFDDLVMGLRQDGILRAYIKDEAIVNHNMQHNIINSIIELKNGDMRKYPALVELGEFISIADDAVSHSGMPFKDHILCVAVYAKNTADRILAKYYTRKFKTSSEFVVFNEFEEAVQYCCNRMNEVGFVFPNK